MAQDKATEILQEYASSAGLSLKVDRENGIIHGVKILGLESRNRRSYKPEALQQAVKLYENVKVNVNHPKGNPSGPRDYQDRMGAIRNVAVRPGEGLYGDFHYNPKHAIAEQFIWDAEHAPENMGFSHNVEARTSKGKDGNTVVEEICRVQSVDLVADPATTRGLFESEDDLPSDPDQRQFAEHGLSALSDARSILLSQEPIENKTTRLQEVLAVWQVELTGKPAIQKELSDMEWKEITEASFKENCPDLYAQITKTDAVSKLDAKIAALTESIKTKDAALTEANAKLAATEAEKAAQAKTLAIAEELKAAKVNTEDTAVYTEEIAAQLLTLADAAARKPIIVLMAMAQRGSVREGLAPFAPLAPIKGSGAVAKSGKELAERI